MKVVSMTIMNCGYKWYCHLVCKNCHQEGSFSHHFSTIHYNGLHLMRFRFDDNSQKAIHHTIVTWTSYSFSMNDNLSNSTTKQPKMSIADLYLGECHLCFILWKNQYNKHLMYIYHFSCMFDERYIFIATGYWFSMYWA